MKNSSLVVVLIITFLFSCTDNAEVPQISFSVDHIEMEAEGGIQEIDLSTVDWSIDRVENVNSDYRIFGDIFSPQNEKINENVRLELEGSGILRAVWQNKGFEIVRNVKDKLEVKLHENSSGEQFGFRIVLSSANGERTITLLQKPSQGYGFKELNYHMDKADGDSLYWRWGSTLKLTVSKIQEIEFNPIGGIDVGSSYFFTSDVSDAFVWLKADSVAVKLPDHFRDGEIYFAAEKGLYTEYKQYKQSDYSALKERIALPVGYSEFRSKFEMRRRILSYTLIIVNNRTGKEKIIEGKFIQITPTGSYSVIQVE